MKRSCCCALAILGLIGTLPAQAQSSTNIGKRSTGVSPGLKPSTGPAVELKTIVRLGPARTWTSSDGKQIVAELVSWPLADPKAAASADVRHLQFDVVRAGQVRLRRDSQTFTLALARLSPEDQAHVRRVMESLKPAHPPETAPRP